jgi:hypothetical protein
MRLLLSNSCPMHSFAVHDSRREDCVSIGLAMVHLADKADCKLEVTQTLRAKLRMLTSKLICAGLHANSAAALRCVDKHEAQKSLAQQLKL